MKSNIISKINIVLLLILICSCSALKVKNNSINNVREYKVLKSHGFDIQFEEIVSEQFTGLETRVYNNCEDMTQADYDLRRYMSITDPIGQILLEKDSFSFSSHDTTSFNIDDFHTFRLNEEEISNFFYKVEKPLSGYYTVNVEFNRNLCQFQFELKQHIQVKNN